MSHKNIILGNPLDSDPETYVQAVRRKNQVLLRETRAVICHMPWVERLEEVAQGEDRISTRVHIATTGSDGREEKKGNMTSPMEAVVLVEHMGKIGKTTRQVRKNCRSVIEDFGFFGAMDVKDLDGDKMSLCYDYDPPTLWPTVLIDAIPLCEKNSDLLERAKERIHTEVCAGKEGRRVIESVQDKLREYKKITAEGKAKFRGSPIEHFDPKEGVLHYDQRNQVKISSVKYGPLRSVQMFLAYRLLQFLRAHPSDPKIVHEFPANTRDKISALLDHNALKLSPNQAKEMGDLYTYFLWCFYLSESAYSTQKKTLVEVPDAQLFRENIENVLKLLQMKG